MKTNLNKLDELTSQKSSGWLDKANWRKENESWLDHSFKIALKILRVLRERGMTQKDLAEKMNVSPQYINKILKGNENFSLDTIATLGKILSIDLFSAISKYEASIDDLGTTTLNGIAIRYASYGSADIVKVKPGSEVVNTISTPYRNPGVYDAARKDGCDQAAAA